MKKLWGFILSAVLLVVCRAINVEAATVLFEHRQFQSIARGVTYELNRQMTTSGMLDIHVLYISLNDPHISIAPIDSNRDMGRKETTSSLVSSAGALAGVNADFFGLQGSYSLPFGPVAANGDFLAISHASNINANEFATLMIDQYNNVLMRYMKTEIIFTNGGRRNVEVTSYNKVGNSIEYPIIVDRNYLNDTSSLDARFSGTMKVLVSDNIVTYISHAGETVEIPENGYALIIPNRFIAAYYSSFWVGQNASLSFTNNININFDTLNMAIGGGGLILSGGELVNDDGIAISGRHPRTAVGVTQDRQTMILMTVDGRSHSIGATHSEMADLLTRYNAYEAMHFDGGGSSTMVLKNTETGTYRVANTVSDGSERRVINALGVFDTSPVGLMDRINLRLGQTHTFLGGPVSMDVFGQDEYLHRIELPPNTVVNYRETTGNATGVWGMGTYTPTSLGEHRIEARFGHYTDVKVLNVHNIVELICHTDSITTLTGAAIPLAFTGITTNALEIPADNAVKVTVQPANLGVFEDGVFYAQAGGAGYLTCEVNGIFTYVPVNIGGVGEINDIFESDDPISFSGYPNTVTGAVSRDFSLARGITRLDYTFIRSNETQAAYINLDKPITFTGRPSAIRMNIYGDNSGNWVRGRLVDAMGTEYLLDFYLSIDFDNWRSVTAEIPLEAIMPVTLNRIYVTSLSCENDFSSALFFDLLQVMYNPTQHIAVPQGQKYSDPYITNLDHLSAGGDVYDFYIQDRHAYAVEKRGNLTWLTMTAAGGGLYAGGAQQWGSFARDINNNTSDYLVVLMDMSPREFRSSKEYELFHLAMAAQQRNNRNVFVVSATSGDTRTTIIDGVRYIELARPESGAPRIRFHVDDMLIRYQP